MWRVALSLPSAILDYVTSTRHLNMPGSHPCPVSRFDSSNMKVKPWECGWNVKYCLTWLIPGTALQWVWNVMCECLCMVSDMSGMLFVWVRYNATPFAQQGPGIALGLEQNGLYARMACCLFGGLSGMWGMQDPLTRLKSSIPLWLALACPQDHKKIYVTLFISYPSLGH